MIYGLDHSCYQKFPRQPAKSFADEGAELIFPNPKNIKDLEPINEFKEGIFNVGNKILIKVTTNDSDQILKKAKGSCKKNAGCTLLKTLKEK